MAKDTTSIPLSSGLSGQSQPEHTAVVKYYYAGGQRVAMRENGTLHYLLGDHLGSTSVTANSSGGKTAELRYYPFGETRYTDGDTPAERRFTGQIEDGTIGLYFYNARYYDPALGRFTQADTIVPNPADPQSLNRYSYVLNNPLKYVDPSGHYYYDPGYDALAHRGKRDPGYLEYRIPMSLKSRWELLDMPRQEAMNHLVDYLGAELGVTPASGVTVRYNSKVPAGRPPALRGENHAGGDDDAYIDIYPAAFYKARNSADTAGVIAHEMRHSHQEAAIESFHKATNIWDKDSPTNATCPAVPTYHEYYTPLMEQDAYKAALALEPKLGYSSVFRNTLQKRYRDYSEQLCNSDCYARVLPEFE